MAKPKTYYVCSECGAETPQWLGKCPACETYNSLQEEIAVQSSTDIPSRGVGAWHSQMSKKKTSNKPAKPRASLKFDQISDRQVERWSSGYGELDRVLGGGVVPGSMVLIGGDPGIGKSTLLLQVSNALSQQYRILYISGEESAQQVKLRGSRLGVAQKEHEEATGNGAVTVSEETIEDKDANKNGKITVVEETKSKEEKVKSAKVNSDLYILPETDLEEILKEIESLRPNLAVIDSIQTVFFPA
ncbi:MAG: ATPase domain-containing protein, partial [Rivularia sp. (in: cyanobacteria)]